MKKAEQELNRFIPPKLPFGWLATTFITPVVIAVLPDIFTKDEIPITSRAIIALAVLSIMLFTSCIILVLRYYDAAYTQQLIQNKVESLKENHESLLKEKNNLFEYYEKSKEPLINRISTLETNAAKTLDELKLLESKAESLEQTRIS